MLSEERQEVILGEIVEKGIAKVEDLVILTNSSESTIRRDLSILEKNGQVKRIHGGAVLNKEKREDKVDKNIDGKFDEKTYEKEDIDKVYEEKKETMSIHKFAASLIKNGDSIYLGSDKDVYEMIKFIDKKDIFVVTNGIENIKLLLEKDIDVYILGGKVKKSTKGVVGTNTFNELERFRFNKSFIGINAIDIEFGFTVSDQEEAMIKTKAIELSREAFILADSSKFNKMSFTKISDFEKVTVITDKENKQYSRKLDLMVVN